MTKHIVDKMPDMGEYRKPPLRKKHLWKKTLTKNPNYLLWRKRHHIILGPVGKTLISMELGCFVSTHSRYYISITI